MANSVISALSREMVVSEESMVKIAALICSIGLLFFIEVGVDHQCQKCIQYLPQHAFFLKIILCQIA